MPDERIDHEPWPLRAALLLVLGALLGLAFDWLVSKGAYHWTRDVARLSGASFLVVGSVTWLYSADRLVEFPMGVFSIALATVILPGLSSHHSEKSPEKFNATLDWALRLTTTVVVPAAIGWLVPTAREKANS